MKAPAANDSPAAMPSQNVRTAINFLLFVHFFSLGALLVLNHSSSELAQKLRRIPGYYLQVLFMDIDFDSGQPFRHRRYPLPEDAMAERDNPRDLPRGRRGRYHLTQGEVYDCAFFVEVEIPDPIYIQQRGGSYDGERRVVFVPDLDISPKQRYLRYHTLAWEAARLNGQEDVDPILLGGIGGGVLREHNVPRNIPCRVRVWRLLSRSPEQVLHADESVRDKWNKRAPEPDLGLEGTIVLDMNGNVQFSRSLPVNEVAPPPGSVAPTPGGAETPAAPAAPAAAPGV
jgi:hypothetical protein